jgi:hypothetical protein
MPKPRQRNHYIPQYLLRRFGSPISVGKRKKKKYLIWQYSQNNPPCRISTKDAAVAKYFHGKECDDLEIAFSHQESRFGGILSRIDQGADLSELHDELKFLVWSHAARTMAIRSRFAEATQTLIEELNSPETAEAIHSGLKHNYDQLFYEEATKAIAHLPLDQQEAALALFQSQGIKEEGRARIESDWFRGVVDTHLTDMLDHLVESDVMGKAAEKGHIRALTKIIDDEKAPEWFEPKYWSLLECSDRSIVLGDSCVLARSKEKQLSPLIGIGDECQDFFLPISSTHVLAGTFGDKEPIVSFEELNNASATVSHFCFYSRYKNPDLVNLAGTIGMRAHLVSPEAMNALVSEVTTEIAEGRFDHSS